MNLAPAPYHAVSILERITDGVLSMNDSGQLTYINEAARTLLNLPMDNLYDMQLDEVLAGELLRPLKKRLMRAIKTQEEIHAEIQLANDQTKWVEIHLYPSSDGGTVLIRDISSAKQVQKTIEENHKKLVLLNETANHLFFKNEPNEIVDSLFKELADYLDLDLYFNYIYDETKGKIRLMIFHGIPDNVAKEIEWLEFGEAICGCVARDRKRMVAEQIDLSEDPRVQLVKGFGIRAYACYPLLSYGKLIGTLSFGSSRRAKFTDEELELIYTICSQVTITLERTFMLEELKRKKEEAEKANKAKSEFMSMMSHELRTPLNSILGFAQILEDNSMDPLTIQQQDKIRKILKSGRHLLFLINNILDIGRFESGKQLLHLEAVKVETIMKESLKMIQPLADERDGNR